MIKYVDFDGVILDSETHMFDEYELLLESKIVDNDYEYVGLIDWYRYLLSCPVINNSLEILKEVKDACILTKVCSMHEAISKKKYLKDKKVSNPLICVPYYKKKSDLVLAKNSILIDNSMRNLREWENDGGIPIFFNKDNLDYDNSDRKNIKYQKTNTLELLYKLD